MKKDGLNWAFVFFTALGIGSETYAQSNLVQFRDPVNQAINHNKSIKNATLENRKLGLDRDAVKGKWLPTVSANALYGYLNTGISIDLPTQVLPIAGVKLFEGSKQANLSTQMVASGITATQAIFTGLQVSNGEKAISQKMKVQNLMLEANYDVLAQEIVQSFDQLMLLKQIDLLINDSEKRLNREHLKVSRAISNGLAIPYDRDKIKLAILELESKRFEVQTNRELLYANLEELTSVSTVNLLELSYELDQIVLSNAAWEMNRKELQALVTAQKAYEYVLKKEKGATLPLVFAFGNVSYLNAFDTDVRMKDLPQMGDLKIHQNKLQMAPTYAVGLGVKWNILEGKSHKTNIEKAKIDLQINENKLIDTREKLTLLQQKNRSAYELGLKKVGVSVQQVTIAKNNLNLASRQFEEGLLDVTERLEAENEFYKHSLNYFQQVLAQRSAAIELLKANGNLYQTINK